MKNASLHLPTSVLQELTDYCRRRLPFESGGFLVGRCLSGQACQVTRFRGVETSLFRTDRFRFRAQSALDALLSSAELGDTLLATVHSHPFDVAEPSQTDLSEACGYGTLWHMIISFAEREPICSLFTYSRSSFGIPYATSAELQIAHSPK